jgi:outer membrane protein assembly factor BamB
MARLLFAFIAVMLGSAGAGAQDWAQWRGPARDGTLPAAVVPKTWPAATTRTWQVEVGEGYASPVVSGGRAFVHSRRDPNEVVTAIDLASGKVLWQQTYPAAFQKNQYATQMAKGPNSTPLVAGSLLYTLGVTGILTAWNVTDGTLAWRQDYSASIDTSKLFCGTAMSPAIEGGALIVQVGSDVHGGRVLALDPATGKERWVTKGLGPGYASPLAVTIQGTRQLITLTNGSIIGLDAATGALLWSVPFPDEWHENIATPVWTGTHVVVSGTRQGTHAYAIALANGKWTATQAWRNAEVTMYTSSPVYADGRIYGMSSKRRGQLVALDATTGELKWATQGRDGNHASILLAPRHVMFLTDAGSLIVANRATDTYVEAKRYEVSASATWSLPVLLPDGLLVREATGVTRWAWK